MIYLYRNNMKRICYMKKGSRNIYWIVLVLILVIVKFRIDNEKNIYNVELEKFNISSNNSEARLTTIGINIALDYAKKKGYKKVRLPEGHYAIDTSIITKISLEDNKEKWINSSRGIIMQSDMELILDGVKLQMIDSNSPQYSIISITNCKNSKIKGGEILGDRKTHIYGMDINNNSVGFESGAIDNNIGNYIEGLNGVVTKNYIDNFNNKELPKEFFISVKEKTTKNTVDGGKRYVYCFDNNEKYLGLATGGSGFRDKITLIENNVKNKNKWYNKGVNIV